MESFSGLGEGFMSKRELFDDKKMVIAVIFKSKVIRKYSLHRETNMNQERRLDIGSAGAGQSG